MHRSAVLTYASEQKGLNHQDIAHINKMIAEERRYAVVAAPTAALSALWNSLKSVSGQPDRTTAKGDPVALLAISRQRARQIVAGIDNATSLCSALRYLRAAAAKAILDTRDRTVSEVKARRRAMRNLEQELLRVDLSAPRRQSRFNFFSIVQTYTVLTRGEGRYEFEYRNLEAMADRREPVIIRCPLAPYEAVRRLARLYGFNSTRAALRYLIDVLKLARSSAAKAGLSKVEIQAILRGLPFDVKELT